MMEYKIWYGFTGSHEWTSPMEVIIASDYEEAEDYAYSMALEAMDEADDEDGTYDLIAYFHVEEV